MFSLTALKLLFTTAKGWLKMLPYIIVISLVLFAGYKAYNWADGRGASRIQAQWDKETEDYKRAIAALKATLVVKEQDHLIATTRINNELAETVRLSDLELSRIAAEYERRLRLSADRAEIYQRQAEGGPASCTSLAGHTARLDESIEEGRRVVEDLRSIVGLRDRQLTQVGQQLLADRALYAELEPGK